MLTPAPHPVPTPADQPVSRDWVLARAKELYPKPGAHPGAHPAAQPAGRLAGRSGQSSLLGRLLQHHRPRICPFERLLAHVPTGSRVLDVGCGGGLLLGLLAAAGRLSTEPGRASIGFDSSRGAIDTADAMLDAWRARRGSPAPIEFRCLGVEEPWPEGAFDCVTIVDVMHHVPPAHQRSTIQLAATHVRPGGVLLYKDMCRRPRWRAWANRLHDLALARQWIHYADVRDVESWARDAGLALIASEDHARLWYGHELRVFRRER